MRSAFNSVYVPRYGYAARLCRWDTSAAYKDAVLRRINFYRAMAGVPSISSLDPVRNAKAQKGAVMLYANHALSHTPPGAWLQYTPEGAEALGKSNICQGLVEDPGCITQYMDDKGSNNAVVGHRRWLVYPQTQQMATGDVPEPLGSGYTQLWNATWVVEPNTILYGPRPAMRDEFTAWPPKGYVPYPLMFNRWSFHYPGAGFTAASVSVNRNGVAMSVTVESRADALSPGFVNAPDNQIVFLIGSSSPDVPATPVNPGQDATYTVTINNVIVNGVPRSFTYNVISFDPASGGAPVGPGTPSVVSFGPVSGSGYAGTFTGTFQQSSGNHYLAYLLFLPTPNVVMYTATGSCLVEYNKYSNGVRLIDNAGTGWLGPLSGVPIGPGAPTLANNQCSVNVANVVANVSGNTMTVTTPVTFFGALGPVLGTFTQALDSNGVWTGMTQFGNWSLPGAPPSRLGPTISSFSASTTAGNAATYTIVSSHTGGASQLSMITLLASASITGAPACQLVYFPGANTLNLVNDAGTTSSPPAVWFSGNRDC